jgi:hypothetical protein
MGQPAYPWRGRITCSPAAGYAAASTRRPPQASRSRASSARRRPATSRLGRDSVAWTGGADWGLRRMILHYAHLCAAAGGVDAFLIGSELRGVTTIRDGRHQLPGCRGAPRSRRRCAVHSRSRDRDQLRRRLVGVLRASRAAGRRIRSGRRVLPSRPALGGCGDRFRRHRPLLAALGLARRRRPCRRRGGLALDLRPRLPAGQHRAAARATTGSTPPTPIAPAQVRTPITDGAAGKPWVFRYKDLRAGGRTRMSTGRAASRARRPPPGRPRASRSASPRSAVPRSTGGPTSPTSSSTRNPPRAPGRISRGAGATTPSSGRYLEAALAWWDDPANNPASGVYAGRMIETAESAVWTWDARPYPAFPALSDVWADGENWRLGHWLSGRLGAVSLGALVRRLCLRAGLTDADIDVADLADVVPGYAGHARIESPRASIAPLMRLYGFDAVESEGRIGSSRAGRRGVRADLPGRPRRRERWGDRWSSPARRRASCSQALKWRLLRADEDYDAMTVEAQRATGARPAIARRASRSRPSRAMRSAAAAARSARNGSAARPPFPAAALAARAGSRRRDRRWCMTGAADRLSSSRASATPARGRRGGAHRRRPLRSARRARSGRRRFRRSDRVRPPTVVLLDLPQLREDQPRIAR